MVIYLNDQYYEAIIQLRPAKKEIIDFVYNEIDKRKDVFITQIIKLKTGLDLYVTSQRFARSLGRQLKKRFKGDLKITKKLYGMDRLKSKQIYRGTILFRSE